MMESSQTQTPQSYAHAGASPASGMSAICRGLLACFASAVQLSGPFCYAFATNPARARTCAGNILARMSAELPILVIVVAAILAFTTGAFIARRQGHNQSREVVSRCCKGHLFTTVRASKLSW